MYELLNRLYFISLLYYFIFILFSGPHFTRDDLLRYYNTDDDFIRLKYNSIFVFVFDTLNPIVFF